MLSLTSDQGNTNSNETELSAYQFNKNEALIRVDKGYFQTRQWDYTLNYLSFFERQVGST